MNNPITIREAVSNQDIGVFWEQLHSYHWRDIFPESDSEDLAFDLSREYREHMMTIHDRAQDRYYFLFFCRNGQDIGFAMPVIYTSEDGKCFLMEFCVYPQFRGNGTGTACAQVFLRWAREHGALYAELNHGGNSRRQRFWKRAGFVSNGADEWGEPLMLLPPEERLPITLEILEDPEDWQLKKLENGFLAEIGEGPAPEERQARLSQAILEGKITFFLAKRGYRAVGMCSVATCFSTFTCQEIGLFDDFFIEPAFRRQGIARMLTQAAHSWCAQRGIPSLTVCCAPCDQAMYQSLGFDTQLGTTFAHLT